MNSFHIFKRGFLDMSLNITEKFDFSIVKYYAIHCLEKLALLLERNEDEVNRCCVPCWRASEQFALKRPVDWRIDRVNREAASFCIACRSPPQSGRHLAEGLSMWGRLKMEPNGLHNLWLARATNYIYRKWTSWEKCRTKQSNKIHIQMK